MTALLLFLVSTAWVSGYFVGRSVEGNERDKLSKKYKGQRSIPKKDYWHVY